MEHLDDDLNTLDELEEEAIEVKPEIQQRTEKNLTNRSLRNSTVVDDDSDGKIEIPVSLSRINRNSNFISWASI